MVAVKFLDQSSEEEWDEVMAVNVKSIFFSTKHALPYFRRQRGGCAHPRQLPGEVICVAGSLPRDKHLLIHCHSGMRSMRVTEYLRAQGFPAVSNVGGGIAAWATRIDPGMARY